MKYVKKGANSGRKKIEIDFELLEKLCTIQCTQQEISAILEVSVDTIQARVLEKYNCDFTDFYKKHSDNGKMSLRRKMFQTALGGNVTMMIWLSKQYLGMTEKIENTKADEKLDLIVEELKKF